MKKEQREDIVHKKPTREEVKRVENKGKEYVGKGWEFLVKF